MRYALLWLALLVALAGAAISETRLDIPQARLAAARLIDGGRPGPARDITAVLLDRDPSDIAALILHSHASRMLGEQPRAQAHARQAWRLSDRPLDRYGAAMAMAQSLSSGGRKTMAQLWLRRAVETAPTDGTRALAVRDYRYLRMTNPWQVSLNAAYGPTDNINNAPRDNTLEFGNLVLVNPTAVPLSGARLSVGGKLRRNLNIARTQRDFVAVFWDESQAHLSSSARRAFPSVRASDFDYRQYGIEVGRDFAPGPDQARSTLALRAARSRYGGTPLSDELRLRFHQQRDLKQGRRLAWSAEIARAERQDNAVRSATIGALAAQLSVPAASGGRLDWFGAVERHASDSPAIAHDAVVLGLRWTAAEPVMGAELSLGVDGEYRRFDRALYGPEPRADVGLSVSASLFFRNLDAYGFAPKLTIEADRTNSNVSLFESEKFGLSLALQSVF